MRNDAELLRSYAEKKSEEAFAELVRRHVNLVYSAALRQVGGDTHLAQDIAQSVFHDLARKATALAGREGLTGWLYTSTHFAATKMMRGESRRRVREQEAFSMIDPPTAPELEWERIQPVLDEVMHELDERDREAVLLRYFEKRSLSEVGRRIGVTENAARMRIERALEKLRSLLAKRGVSSTAAALAAVLTAQTISAAPAGLAGAITASVIATTATSISSGTAIIKIMSMTKLQIGVVSAVVVAGVATPIVLQQQTNARLRAEMAALQQQAETTKLRAENKDQGQADASELERLRKEHGELNRLRGEMAGLRSRTQELAKAQADLSQLQTKMRAAPPAARTPEGNIILAEGLVPALSWNNAGLNTPAASFETWHWAKNQGDIKALAISIVLDANAKPKADALFATLPETLRAKFSTPEEMMAGLLANTTAVAGMRVLGQTEQGPDDVTVRGQWQYADGRVRDGDLPFHRYPDGWRQVVPEGLVDKLGGMLREPALRKSAGK